MKRLILAIGILLIPGIAETAQNIDEPVCFADADGVRHHSPDKYPSWTYNMPGHKGSKCWFPGERNDKKWHPAVSKQTKVKKEVYEPKVAVSSVNLTRSLRLESPIEQPLIEKPQPIQAPKVSSLSKIDFDYRFNAAYMSERSTNEFMKWAGSLF